MGMPAPTTPPVPAIQDSTALAPEPSATVGSTVHIVRPEDWDGLLMRCPARTVFHRLAWLRAIARRYGLELVLLAAGDPAAPVLVWPWLRQRKGPLVVAGSPLPGWGTAYLGPLAAEQIADQPELAAAAAESILREPLLRKASHLEVRIITADQAVPLLAGFERLREFSTYVLDLRRTEDELWANLDRKCRNAVRRGERQGYRVERESGRDWIDPFLAMAREVFAQWGQRPPYDRALLEAIADELEPAGQLWVYSSWRQPDEVDGHGDAGAARREATSLFFVDDRRVYYWAAGSFDAAKQRAPNNILVWEVIKAARAQGLEQLDFISASGSAGRYKKTFGPEEVAVCEHLARSRTPIEALLKRAYERFFPLAARARLSLTPMLQCDRGAHLSPWRMRGHCSPNTKSGDWSWS